MSDEQSAKKKNEHRRYLGKVKSQEGKYGKFLQIWIDNPHPNKADGTQEPYYKGSLIWLDAQTGKKYLVKQLAVRGVSQKSAEAGFVQSITIDLDSSFEVEEL